MSHGVLIGGDSFNDKTLVFVRTFASKFPLIICDPPYGNITKQSWDIADYFRWMTLCSDFAKPDATICMWGGIGRPGDRPFLAFISQVENNFPGWTLRNLITWGKKRAYGVSNNYLFTREECAILIRGEPTFNIPLLKTRRGYAGYNKKYPAKSEFFRRTNVWTDVTELLRNKIHPTQKPDELYEILVSTHSLPQDDVLDLAAGSMTTARVALQFQRNFCCVEIDRRYITRDILEYPNGRGFLVPDSSPSDVEDPVPIFLMVDSRDVSPLPSSPLEISQNG